MADDVGGAQKSKSHNCADRLEDVLSVLETHSRILEAHAKAIGGIAVTLKQIQFDLESIHAAQRTQNQLTANIHQLWSKLKCVAPDPSEHNDGVKRLSVAEEFRQRSSSDEFRQLSVLGVSKAVDDD